MTHITYNRSGNALCAAWRELGARGAASDLNPSRSSRGTRELGDGLDGPGFPFAAPGVRRNVLDRVYPCEPG